MDPARVMFVNHTSTVSGAELILADAVQPWAGATAFLFEDGPLNRALAARGLTVTRARRGGNLAALRRDSSPLRAAPLAARLAALTGEVAACARRHDVVYANSQKAFVLAALATTVVRRPLIWHLHDILDADHFGVLQRRLQVTLANARAAAVVVPSTAAARAFVAAGGSARIVRVVANGLDVTPDPRSRPVLRRDLGLPQALLVGVFSRLAHWKGQHVLLSALAGLPGVHALVAGAPLFGEDAYLRELEAQAVALGIADRVHFLGQRDDVPLLMQAVDAVVHPSIHPEPFGRTLVEAMLGGTPVVATRTGAAAEILEEGRAGLLVPPSDPAALVAALSGLLADPAAAAGQVAHARDRARTHYGVARMRGEIAALIGAVARGERP